MKHIEIYTDGACSGNPGPGGWGAILRFRTAQKVYEKELSGGEANTTNNRMEMTALLEALRQLKEPCAIDLYSDSKYVIDSLQKGWARGWRARGWKKADKSPALNPDLWAPLLAESEKHEITYHWLKGHAGHPENERCDRMAVEQSKSTAGGKPDAAVCYKKEKIMDGFNTFEKQDKILLGLNSGSDAAAALRILQQQGFAVQTFTVENAVSAAELLQLLTDKAAELDCAFIATGHFARIEVDREGISRVLPATDADADQSAALRDLPQEILAKLVLPLGDFTKADVEEILTEKAE